MILLADLLVYRKRPARMQLAGVLLSTLGVAVVVTRADPAVLLSLTFGRGDIYVFCAVIGWAL